MKKLNILLILCILILSGCSQSTNENIVCNKPYIRVADSCCLDKDDNSICDKDEIIDTKEDNQDEGANLVLENEKINEIKSYNIHELERGINDIIGTDLQKYSFKVIEGDKTTPFEETYDIYESLNGRDIFLINIKDKTNYLASYSTFYEFKNKLFDIKVEGYSDTFSSEIKLFKEEGGQEITGTYIYSLSTTDEKGRILEEIHTKYFVNNLNSVQDVYSDYSHSIFCTKEWIIKLYPDDKFKLEWSITDFESAKKMIDREYELYNNDISKVSKELLSLCEGLEGDSKFESKESLVLTSKEVETKEASEGYLDIEINEKLLFIKDDVRFGDHNILEELTVTFSNINYLKEGINFIVYFVDGESSEKRELAKDYLKLTDFNEENQFILILRKIPLLNEDRVILEDSSILVEIKDKERNLMLNHSKRIVP